MTGNEIDKIRKSGGNEKGHQPPKAKIDWYITFISVVFGLMIAVWLIPVVELFDGTSRNIGATWEILSDPKKSGKGVLAFVILICLWWWYGPFLGDVAPAKSFSLFFLDFISLGNFAIGFRMWNNQSLFPMVVIFGSLLVFIRLGVAWRASSKNSQERKAITMALITLFLFLLIASTLVIGAYWDSDVVGWGKFLQSEKDVGSWWDEIAILVNYFLGFVFLVTCVAASITRGLIFANR